VTGKASWRTADNTGQPRLEAKEEEASSLTGQKKLSLVGSLGFET